MTSTQIHSIKGQNRITEACHALQNKAFSAPAWPLMQGRRELIRKLPFPIEKKVKVLEVGCGAGYNLKQLAHWLPNALVTGLEEDPRMMAKADTATAGFRDRVELKAASYFDLCERIQGQMDAILLSYTLTAQNVQWKELIQQAKEGLRPGGFLAVVDFHNSRFSWFKSLMSRHQQVQMDRQLLPFLKQEFQPLKSEIYSAGLGAWEYFLFLGRNPF